MRPSINWMVLACVFMTGLYAGRISREHWWVHLLLTIMFLLVAVIWAVLRNLENRRYQRKSMADILREHRDG